MNFICWDCQKCVRSSALNLRGTAFGACRMNGSVEIPFSLPKTSVLKVVYVLQNNYTKFSVSQFLNFKKFSIFSVDSWADFRSTFAPSFFHSKT